MATTYKTLGQSHPNAATSTTLYTCPSSTNAVATVYACNQSSVATSIRVGVDVGGGGDANTDYIAYDLPIGANQTLKFTGLCLSATDLLRVYTTLATVSFNAFGPEFT